MSKVMDLLISCGEIVNDIAEEEREAYENLPDSIRDSSRGEEFQDSIDALGEIGAYLDGAMYAVERI